jgi:hypothetical protein
MSHNGGKLAKENLIRPEGFFTHMCYLDHFPREEGERRGNRINNDTQEFYLLGEKKN